MNPPVYIPMDLSMVNSAQWMLNGVPLDPERNMEEPMPIILGIQIDFESIELVKGQLFQYQNYQ